MEAHTVYRDQPFTDPEGIAFEGTSSPFITYTYRWKDVDLTTNWEKWSPIWGRPGGWTWKLKFYPVLDQGHSVRTYGLYLVCIPTVSEELSTGPNSWRRDVKSINLIALNRDGFALRNYTTRTVYCEQELRRGYKAYIDDEVLYRDSGVAATKRIDVVCKIRYMAEHERIDMSKVEEMGLGAAGLMHGSMEMAETGEEVLADGFEELVNNPKYSDLTIIVGGGPANVDAPPPPPPPAPLSSTTSITTTTSPLSVTTPTPTSPTSPTSTSTATNYPPQQSFHAHKSILCTRSSFFSRLCDTPMRETLTNTVRLPEDDPRTFATLLRYFYTGRYHDAADVDLTDPSSTSTSTSVSSTSTLLPDSHSGPPTLTALRHAHRARVFVAADKYGALRLKRHVRAVMIQSLSVENLVQVIRFAYGTPEAGEDEELRNAVCVFAARQMGRLKQVPEFKELIESGGRYAKFAFDVMDRMDALKVA
ncbi:hypothetical protein BC936DRAFT_145206 [Jimgerdemannia flammicorona]|uniref:BTB domain-containing protein n=1 Tax=Jimgerdemannia flammicorona TaxID=994334 RepID=A0A433DAN4_9FUNG|nr:hypothetical protein BC936DRAFT_145206 [Jimgerdemannia flammicorona]